MCWLPSPDCTAPWKALVFYESLQGKTLCLGLNIHTDNTLKQESHWLRAGSFSSHIAKHLVCRKHSVKHKWCPGWSLGFIFPQAQEKALLPRLFTLARGCLNSAHCAFLPRNPPLGYWEVWLLWDSAWVGFLFTWLTGIHCQLGLESGLLNDHF